MGYNYYLSDRIRKDKTFLRQKVQKCPAGSQSESFIMEENHVKTGTYRI